MGGNDTGGAGAGLGGSGLGTGGNGIGGASAASGNGIGGGPAPGGYVLGEGSLEAIGNNMGGASGDDGTGLGGSGDVAHDFLSNVAVGMAELAPMPDAAASTGPNANGNANGQSSYGHLVGGGAAKAKSGSSNPFSMHFDTDFFALVNAPKASASGSSTGPAVMPFSVSNRYQEVEAEERAGQAAGAGQTAVGPGSEGAGAGH